MKDFTLKTPGRGNASPVKARMARSAVPYRCRWRHVLSLLIAVAFCASGAAQSPERISSSSSDAGDLARYSDGLRRWTARDSVAVRYFEPATIETSPDGTHFFFVSSHGDLECDCDWYELTVFAAHDVATALRKVASGSHVSPEPIRRLVRRSANGHRGAIWSARWEPDGKSIFFRGVSDEGIPQLYLFDVHAGELRALTNWKNDVLSMTRVGDTVISDVYVPRAVNPPTYPVHTITLHDLRHALMPSEVPTTVKTFVSYRGGEPWEISSSDYSGRPPFLSSDGRRAIASRLARDVPESWSVYDAIGPDVSRFVLVDAEHGRSVPVFDAPTGEATSVGSRSAVGGTSVRALWAADNRNVVLVNTALPLTSHHPDRSRMAYVVGYNTDNRNWSVIEPLEHQDSAGNPLRRVTRVDWLDSGRRRLLVTHEDASGKPAPATVYTLQGDRWVPKRVDSPPSMTREQPSKQPLLYGITVTLRQGANQPPMVVASDGKHEVVLTSPDPALRDLWWARSEPFQWREPNGETVTGGLLMPRNSSAVPVPLVIQTYTYEPHLFQPDGPARHAYAAQALVARGIAVLNVDRTQGTGLRELTAFVERIDSAVSALASRGLVDPTRVGAVGFSRAGFLVSYAISHPRRVRLAAAVIDDAFPGTYSYYLSMQAVGGPRQAFESLYGGTFWESRDVWLEHEFSFNTHRVETPALFTAHGQQGVGFAAETIGAFSLNQRPLEYLLFPRGKHVLGMPRERHASQEATVDWMSFWLQGYEDSSPGKRDRYKRWRQMRRLNEERKRVQ